MSVKKVHSFSYVTLYGLLFSLIIVAGCGPRPEKVTIKGSTTVLPITLKAIDAYSRLNHNAAISVGPR